MNVTGTLPSNGDIFRSTAACRARPSLHSTVALQISIINFSSKRKKRNRSQFPAKWKVLSWSFKRWPHLAQPPTGTRDLRELSGPVAAASDLQAPLGLSSHTAFFPQSSGTTVSAGDRLYPELLADTTMAGQAEQRPPPAPPWVASQGHRHSLLHRGEGGEGFLQGEVGGVMPHTRKADEAPQITPVLISCCCCKK